VESRQLRGDAAHLNQLAGGNSKMSNESRQPDQSGEADRMNENRPSHRNQGGLPIRHTYDQNRASQDSANPDLAEQPGRQGQKPNVEKKTA
jgi:hypothetical protein